MKSIIFIFILFYTLSINGQTNKATIAFYNTENLFDYFHDSLKNDLDFTPTGIKGWGKKKYEAKQAALFKAITAIGYEQEPPAVVGLCEVENNRVLQHLTQGTPMRKFNYRYIHHESADPRGIDVALLYRPNLFTILEEKPLPLIFPPDSISATRDFLYVKGIIFTDTIHFFIVHFPSKYGGLTATKEKRNIAGKIMRQYINDIFLSQPNANIIVMGDFNDEPTDESISNELGAYCEQNHISPSLINLMCPFVYKQGSHKFQGEWSIIDQIIVSDALYAGKNHISIEYNQAEIFCPDFLLMPDEKYFGKKPFRTFNGPVYLGGYSDHLPVFIRLISKDP